VEGTVWGGPKVIIKIQNWTVTLDSVTDEEGGMTYTRLRAPYANPNGFRFRISSVDFPGPTLVGRLFANTGMERVEVGQPEFDRNFISECTDPETLRRLLEHAPLRERLQAETRLCLQVKHDEEFFAGWSVPAPPADVDELCFQTTGLIKDVERLKTLFDLLGVTLQQLGQIGSAREAIRK
jgi:hypothetical protein